MTLNAAGVRDSVRPLKIGISTVKKLATKRITSSPVAHADVALICELDEQWNFVGSKSRQHWLWIRKGQLHHSTGDGLSPAEQFYLLAA